ncbi:MAG: queuosine precursor transporter, partial [Chloroflexota bacterium]|nr:queuosine precursor transporter [Chloroflexota bacterium]
MRFTGTFIIVVTVFVTVLITSNIISVKPIELITLPFEFIGSKSVIIPAAIIIFPVSYIVGDILTEVYGFRIARGVIWLGFAANLLVVIALWLAGLIPGAGFWEDQEAYDTILGQVPWILVASFIAYLIGEFSNSTVLALLKYKMQGRLLFVRSIGSTVVGRGGESFSFI